MLEDVPVEPDGLPGGDARKFRREENHRSLGLGEVADVAVDLAGTHPEPALGAHAVFEKVGRAADRSGMNGD
ncbi:hypothetical protein [Actinomadura madurae]|uniref:hypothetical protein n=1 Tax=Actinomadura madurae TaxID=1993 RepID=UPI001C681DD8|nr:hypothetical protein [Actinomadura madurae]